MKKRYFLRSLIAAGFIGSPNSGSATLPDLTDGPDTSEKKLFDTLRLNHIYTLAAHRSHSSHGSHRSSSGGSYTRRKPAVRSVPLYTPPAVTSRRRSNSSSGSRNLNTTPRVSILPATPAITKPKRLPGHTEKFKAIVKEVQFALMAFGYYNGAIDGFLGPESKSALAKFQADSGMKVTGTINKEVLDVFGIRAK